MAQTADVDYQAGLGRLWGEDTLRELMGYVDRGAIQDNNIRSMAIQVGFNTCTGFVDILT